MLKKIFTYCLMSMLILFVSGANSYVYAAELLSTTPVLIQSDTNISDETHKSGDIVKFHVVNAVKDSEGNVVLAAGMPIRATITRLEQKKRMGRPAEVSVGGFTATLRNGKQIAFNGSIKQKSESRMARSIALGAAIIPFFLLMKGAGANLPSGSQLTVYPSVNYSL